MCGANTIIWLAAAGLSTVASLEPVRLERQALDGAARDAAGGGF